MITYWDGSVLCCINEEHDFTSIVKEYTGIQWCRICGSIKIEMTNGSSFTTYPFIRCLFNDGYSVDINGKLIKDDDETKIKGCEK